LERIDIAHAFSAEDALAIKTDLDKGGVPSFLGPNNIDNVDDYHGSFEDGVEIRVLASDQQRAARASAQFFPATAEEEPTEGDEYRAGCPKCHSDEIVFLELHRSARPTNGEPKFHWHSDACGNDWADDGVEEN
jgi:DNA-directed RNA polymerase subunit M/transcription elongation factor TFIIS